MKTRKQRLKKLKRAHSELRRLQALSHYLNSLNATPTFCQCPWSKAYIGDIDRCQNCGKPMQHSASSLNIKP